MGITNRDIYYIFYFCSQLTNTIYSTTVCFIMSSAMIHIGQIERGDDNAINFAIKYQMSLCLKNLFLLFRYFLSLLSVLHKYSITVLTRLKIGKKF